MATSIKIELPEGNDREEDLISIVFALEYLYRECQLRDLTMTSHFIGVAFESCKDEMRKLSAARLAGATDDVGPADDEDTGPPSDPSHH